MTNFPKVFASTQKWIPIFWVNMTNTYHREANMLKLLMFLTIYGSKSNKNLLNNSKMAKYYSIFCLNAIWYWLWYSLWGWILRPWIITFLICLLFNLGYRGLLFASTMNLEAGPRLARIWLILFFLLWYFS